MSQHPNRQDKIVIDYYQGAYGPTIRIDIQTMENLVNVKNIFLLLANSKKERIELVKVESVKAIGVSQLILEVVPSDEEHEKKLKLEDGPPENMKFRWCMSSTAWHRCAGLIDGLIESNRPGHQYLTKEGIDDALVEVAFIE